MPAALALDTACGLKALSMKGSKASSVGILRRSSSSTMWNRYLLDRPVMRWMYSGRLEYHCSRSETSESCKSGIANPRRMRSHNSLGASTEAVLKPPTCAGVRPIKGSPSMTAAAAAASVDALADAGAAGEAVDALWAADVPGCGLAIAASWVLPGLPGATAHPASKALPSMAAKKTDRTMGEEGRRAAAECCECWVKCGVR